MIFGRKTEKRLLAEREGSASLRSHNQLLWERFKKNRMALWSLRVVYVLMFVAAFGSFFANEKPLICKLDGRISFPVLQSKSFERIPWREKTYDWAVFPPIPFSANTLNMKSGNFKGPFTENKESGDGTKHWLGTQDLGKDVFAGMIEGTRVAILVGLISMSIATFLGMFFGAIAGYFGDSGIRVSRVRLWMNILALLFGVFYGFMVRGFAYTQGSFGIEILKSLGIVIVIFLIFNGLAVLLKRIPLFNKKVSLPVDFLVMRFIEIINAMPGLLLLLAAVAIIKEPNIFIVMAIIGLISWTTIARFMRAELLRIRSLAYIEAARVIGLSEFRILIRHAIPNAMGPVLITIAFGIASAVLLESTLSFLGIGIGEEVTWGKLLFYARVREEAWWLAIFPGLAIFVTVTIFNLIGEGISNAFEAKSETN